jgi:cobaltochelatase CobN
MHRLAAVPGATGDTDGPLYVEQPSAPLLLLSSADTDLSSLAGLLGDEPALLIQEVRGLNLAVLDHPAVIDHYLATSLGDTQLVLVRLLGGRGHWSYGLEQLRRWADGPGRQLVVVAGTSDEEGDLASLGTVAPALALAIGRCLREGGRTNLRRVLLCLNALLMGEPPEPPQVEPLSDPSPHDWREDPGPRVGLVLYRALLQAGDTALAEATLAALRQRGLCPRALWVSGLREAGVQRGVADLLGREAVQAVLCTTSFASVQFEEAGLGAPLWEALNVPVLQLLCSSSSRERWRSSSIGLSPLDLSLQVALPELDGRLTTRVGAFKEAAERADARLTTALHRYRPDPERLDWIAQLVQGWVNLRGTAPAQRRLSLVLANYPTRNSRLANGVGLDTPASAAAMLHWLAAAGYDLGAAQGQPPDGTLPHSGQELIERLLAGRSNDAESSHRPPLDHLPLATYQRWYDALPQAGRELIERRWGSPDQDSGLERSAAGAGFPIRGLRFGRIHVLIQPERGYDRDPSLNYHSPDLPPTHAYLAQYLWLRQVEGSQLVVHVGKHGNLEWLPGKGLGLSNQCFPEWALGPMPHLYPFIVNDPGEGSQAKRRAQAVILDHLTPPLGRAGLHGPLQTLEALLDEYWEACQLGSARVAPLRQRLAETLEALELPLEASDLESRIDRADGYLCELKEAQIRTGLHTFGHLPAPEPLLELLLCLARPPLAEGPGLTQALAKDLGLALDPWADPVKTPWTRLTGSGCWRQHRRRPRPVAGSGMVWPCWRDGPWSCCAACWSHWPRSPPAGPSHTRY